MRLSLLGIAFACCSTTAYAGPIMKGPAASIVPRYVTSAIPEAELRNAGERYKKGDFAGCLASLHKLAKKSPNLPPAKLMLARLHFQSNRVNSGRLLLEEVATESPNHPELYFAFGMMAIREGRLTDALVLFEKSNSLAPPNNWPKAQTIGLRSETLFGQAKVWELRKSWKKVEKLLRNLIALDKQNAVAHERLANALFRQGHIDQAKSELKTAIQIQSSLGPVEFRLALLYADTGNHQEANSLLEQAVKNSPQDAALHLEFASFLFGRRDLDRADRLAKRALQLGAKSRQALMTYGLIALHRGKYGDAEVVFSQLYQQSPGDIEAANQLVHALVEQTSAKKRDRAVQLAEVNARSFPRSPEILATLGWTYFKIGRLKRAQSILLRVVGSSASTPLANYAMARVHIALGSRADSYLPLLKKANESTSPFRFSSEIQTLLARPKQSKRATTSSN